MAFATIATTVLSRLEWFTCPRSSIVGRLRWIVKRNELSYEKLMNTNYEAAYGLVDVGEALWMWRHADFGIV